MVAQSSSTWGTSGRGLYRTSVREALDELRGQTCRSRFERLFSFVRESPPTPEHLYAVNAERHRVRTVLGALNRRHAELLYRLRETPGIPGALWLTPSRNSVHACSALTTRMPATFGITWELFQIEPVADRLLRPGKRRALRRYLAPRRYTPATPVALWRSVLAPPSNCFQETTL